MPAPKQTKVKFPRAKADKIIKKVEKHIKPFVDRHLACGSYRRGAQMVGDIDFVIIPKEGVTLPQMLPPNDGINWVGDNKAQVIIDGEKVDFKVTTPDAWGATILYFTGPADFNIKYRWMAKKRGMKLNEYGLWDRTTDAYIAGATEQDIYDALKRPFRDPDQRKGWKAESYELFLPPSGGWDAYIDIFEDFPNAKNFDALISNQNTSIREPIILNSMEELLEVNMYGHGSSWGLFYINFPLTVFRGVDTRGKNKQWTWKRWLEGDKMGTSNNMGVEDSQPTTLNIQEALDYAGRREREYDYEVENPNYELYAIDIQDYFVKIPRPSVEYKHRNCNTVYKCQECHTEYDSDKRGNRCSKKVSDFLSSYPDKSKMTYGDTIRLKYDNDLEKLPDFHKKPSLFSYSISDKLDCSYSWNGYNYIKFISCDNPNHITTETPVIFILGGAHYDDMQVIWDEDMLPAQYESFSAEGNQRCNAVMRHGSMTRGICSADAEYLGYCPVHSTCERCGTSLIQEGEFYSQDEEPDLSDGHSEGFCLGCWRDTGKYGAETFGSENQWIVNNLTMLLTQRARTLSELIDDLGIRGITVESNLVRNSTFVRVGKHVPAVYGLKGQDYNVRHPYNAISPSAGRKQHLKTMFEKLDPREKDWDDDVKWDTTVEPRDWTDKVEWNTEYSDGEGVGKEGEVAWRVMEPREYAIGLESGNMSVNGMGIFAMLGTLPAKFQRNWRNYPLFEIDMEGVGYSVFPEKHLNHSNSINIVITTDIPIEQVTPIDWDMGMGRSTKPQKWRRGKKWGDRFEAEYEVISLQDMDDFLKKRRFKPVDMYYRRKPVKEWVYERKLPAHANHFIRVYTSIQRYGGKMDQSRDVGKDAIRVQVIYRDDKGETLVSMPKRVNRIATWRKNLDDRLTEIAQTLPTVTMDSRGEPMTLRKKKGSLFWGSRDYPAFKETRRYSAEQEDLSEGLLVEDQYNHIDDPESMQYIYDNFVLPNLLSLRQPPNDGVMFGYDFQQQIDHMMAELNHGFLLSGKKKGDIWLMIPIYEDNSIFDISALSCDAMNGDLVMQDTRPLSDIFDARTGEDPFYYFKPINSSIWKALTEGIHKDAINYNTIGNSFAAETSFRSEEMGDDYLINIMITEYLLKTTKNYDVHDIMKKAMTNIDLSTYQFIRGMSSLFAGDFNLVPQGSTLIPEDFINYAEVTTLAHWGNLNSRGVDNERLIHLLRLIISDEFWQSITPNPKQSLPKSAINYQNI